MTIKEFTGISNTPSKIVYCKTPLDLSGTLLSTVIYFIDGIVDFTGSGLSIEIPAGGLNLKGHSFDVSKLICSDNDYTLFTSPVGGSGNVLGQDYAIEVTGTNSKVYDIFSATGFEAFEFQRINYNDCTSLGEIDNYRQGLESGTGRFGGKPELTLTGVWVGGYFIDVSIVRNLSDGAYSLFKAGTGFLMSSRFRTNQNIDLPASASLIDFSSSNFVNPSTVQIQGAIISRDGVFDANDSNISPNLSADNLVCDWNNNNGLTNTFVGGRLTITTDIDTALSGESVDAFLDLAGTYTATDLQHFDSPAVGQLRHNGTSPREYQGYGDITISGNSNDVINLKIVLWDNSASSFVDIYTQTRQINSLVGPRDVAFFNIRENFTLDSGDYVKLQISNSSAARDATAEVDSFFIVEKR